MAQRLAYVLCTVEPALVMGDDGTLLLPGPHELAEAIPGTKPARVERTLFAYRIPYLPDLLTSPHLTGQNERERLAEVLDRQAQLVTNLGKWRHMGFALRYLSYPERGEIEIALVGRGIARTGQGQRLGEELAGDVARALSSFDFPIEPVTADEALQNILEPFPQSIVLELRQREEVVSMLQGDAYVVYPFRPPTTTWIPVFETLLRQQAPCLISIYLEPTELYDFEQRLFSQAAALAETLSDFTFEGLAYRGRLADPTAHVVARIYSDYVRRLTAPFLLTVQVVSPEPMVARAVAQALGAEITECHDFEAVQGDLNLPSGFDVLAPDDLSDLQAAWRTLTALELRPWGKTESSQGKERLRYLVDAHAASAAFRFPVPMRGGVPGVRTRQMAPSYDVGPRVTQVGADELLIGTFSDRGGVAAIPTFGVLPTLIEQALERLYLDKGWNLVDRARPDEQRLYPTLGELYHEIIRVAEERGYSAKTMQDVRGASAGRIGSLLRGSKGRTLNTLHSVPMDELMARPVILELQSLTDEEKALVMMFLLTMIYEYCQVHRESAQLQHVTVVEEAHRVMTAVPHRADRETTADTRAEAVGLFSSLLSEVRAYGEGLIIAEQIPTRLAQDALKNTNIKIVHRLPGEDDRDAIGATMRMDERQREHVAGLTPGRGEAAFFTDGLEKPTFIEVPNVRRERGLPERVPDARVEAHTQAFREAHQDIYLPFAGCRHCQRQCQYRDRAGSLAYDIGAHRAFCKALYAFEQHLRAGDESAAWAALAAECRDVLAPVGLGQNPHAAYCYFVHLGERPLPRDKAAHFKHVYQQARGVSS